MEFDNPADFGIWGRVLPGQASAFRSWIAADLGMPELTAHQLFGNAIKESRKVQFQSGYGWLEISYLLDNVPKFIDKESLAISETDLMPSEEVDFCKVHALYHRRGACPVCSGNFVSRGRRRMWSPP